MAQYALPVLHDASEVKTSWVQLAGDGDGYASDELDEGFGAGRGSGSGPDGATTAWQTDNTSNVTRTYECALATIFDPEVSTGHIIRASVAKSATGGATLTGTLRLYQGVTQIAASAATAITATAYSTISYTLSASEADAITDYSALRLRLTVVISTGTARRGRVSALELETPNEAIGIAWYLCYYKRDALAHRPTRYCAMDDFTAQIYPIGKWSEAEILGNAALVKVKAYNSILATIAQTSGFSRFPKHYNLNDTLGDLTTNERNGILNIALSLGYTQAEINAVLPADWQLVTFRQVLHFLATRRLKPRYDIDSDTIICDGPDQPVRDVDSVDGDVT
jgi:hypothetical protein